MYEVDLMILYIYIWRWVL